MKIESPKYLQYRPFCVSFALSFSSSLRVKHLGQAAGGVLSWDQVKRQSFGDAFRVLWKALSKCVASSANILWAVSLFFLANPVLFTSICMYRAAAPCLPRQSSVGVPLLTAARSSPPKQDFRIFVLFLTQFVNISYHSSCRVSVTLANDSHKHLPSTSGLTKHFPISLSSLFPQTPFSICH